MSSYKGLPRKIFLRSFENVPPGAQVMTDLCCQCQACVTEFLHCIVQPALQHHHFTMTAAVLPSVSARQWTWTFDTCCWWRHRSVCHTVTPWSRSISHTVTLWLVTHRVYWLWHRSVCHTVTPWSHSISHTVTLWSVAHRVYWLWHRSVCHTVTPWSCSVSHTVTLWSVAHRVYWLWHRSVCHTVTPCLRSISHTVTPWSVTHREALHRWLVVAGFKLVLFQSTSQLLDDLLLITNSLQPKSVTMLYVQVSK